MEKILVFFPTIVVMGILVILFRLTYKKYVVPWLVDKFIGPQFIPWLLKKIIGSSPVGDEFDESSFEVLVKVVVILPISIIYAPLREELLFRLPLILVFPNMSSEAIAAILVVGVLFGAIHWVKPFAKNLTGLVSGTAFAESVDVASKKKMMSFIFTFILGIISGYLGVRYQSIWLCVGFHMVWNAFYMAVVVYFMYKYLECK